VFEKPNRSSFTFAFTPHPTPHTTGCPRYSRSGGLLSHLTSCLRAVRSPSARGPALLPAYHALNALTLAWCTALPGLVVANWTADARDRAALRAMEAAAAADGDAGGEGTEPEGGTLPPRWRRGLGTLSSSHLLWTTGLVVTGVVVHALARRWGADTGGLWRWFTFGKGAVGPPSAGAPLVRASY
jgi:hypothetical protein